MVVKLTQEQADFLKTFGNLEDEINKKQALCHITRFGYGYNWIDGVKYPSSAFECYKQLKMVEAVINGYKVIEPKFKFYNFSDSSGGTALYYAGQSRQLTKFEQDALEVKEGSEEYKALLALGFVEEEV